MYHITFPPQSNRASWVFIGSLSDYYTDEPIDLTGCSMVFQISQGDANGYDVNCGLVASTENEKLTFIDTGKFRWFFTVSEMQSLWPGTYKTGLRLTNDDGTQTIQLSVGPLPIVDGVGTV